MAKTQNSSKVGQTQDVIDHLRGVYIKNFLMKDNSKIEMNRNSILIITGPNNCGKSQLLRDISSLGTFCKITKEIEFEYLGDIFQSIIAATQNPAVRNNENFVISNFRALNGDLGKFLIYLRQQQPIYEAVIDQFITNITTKQRISNASILSSDMMAGQMPQDRLNHLKSLYESRQFEDVIYNKMLRVFGKGVVLDRFKFQSNDIYFLNKNDIAARKDIGEPSFIEWLSSTSRIDEQGDGIKSYFNVLLSICNNPKSLVLLDEPEAFLHPPQIRAMAQEIANSLPGNTQMIVATHSTDFIQGMLDYAPGRTSIGRISRDMSSKVDISRIKYLDANEIRQFWQDPLLRTSDAMTGLFHEAAIIVEGETDARFFRVIFDKLEIKGLKLKRDIRFYHCGGKGKMHKIVEALRTIRLPTLCVVDIDILSDPREFRRLSGAFEIPLEHIQSDLKILTASISDSKKQNPVDLFIWR